MNFYVVLEGTNITVHELPLHTLAFILTQTSTKFHGAFTHRAHADKFVDMLEEERFQEYRLHHDAWMRNY